MKHVQFSREKAINRCQSQDGSNAGITKDLKIMIITVSQGVKENTLEMNKRQFFPEKWMLFFSEKNFRSEKKNMRS